MEIIWRIFKGYFEGGVGSNGSPPTQADDFEQAIQLANDTFP